MTDPLVFACRPELREPALVLAFEGWNDAGEAASTALRFFLEEMAAEPMARLAAEDYFDFTVQRPLIRLDPSGLRQVVWPDLEFFHARGSWVFGIGVEPHLRWRSFGDEVVRLARETGVRRVVLLGAFLADVLYSRPVGISCVGGDPDRLEGLAVEAARYEGPTGIVGVLCQRLLDAGIETVAFWAGLPHYITVTPNPRGALALAGARQLRQGAQTPGVRPLGEARASRAIPTSRPAPGRGARRPQSISMDSSISMAGMPSSTG